MPIEHLGYEAAELLSLTNGGEARSLNRLAELAAWQVSACAGAHAAVWHDGEVIAAAATHPDLAELADLQLSTGRGPLVEAVMASCAVPGLLPPVEIDGRHYFDGGLVDSIPVGRAVELSGRSEV